DVEGHRRRADGISVEPANLVGWTRGGFTRRPEKRLDVGGQRIELQTERQLVSAAGHGDRLDDRDPEGRCEYAHHESGKCELVDRRAALGGLVGVRLELSETAELIESHRPLRQTNVELDELVNLTCRFTGRRIADRCFAGGLHIPWIE